MICPVHLFQFPYTGPSLPHGMHVRLAGFPGLPQPLHDHEPAYTSQAEAQPFPLDQFLMRQGGTKVLVAPFEQIQGRSLRSWSQSARLLTHVRLRVKLTCYELVGPDDSTD